jgi:hypothetical protein
VATTTWTEPAEVRREAPAPRWVLRGVGVLVVWTLWAFLVGATTVLTGNGGNPAGQAIATGAMLVALVPTWLLVRPSPYRRWLSAVATVALVAVGLNLGAVGGPSLAQMTGVGASLPVATGAQLLTTSSVENGLCLLECSRVTHLYAVLDYTTARSKVGTALLTSGWDALDPSTYCQGRFGVRLADTADPSMVDPPVPPPGMELLSVSTSECERG